MWQICCGQLRCLTAGCAVINAFLFHLQLQNTGLLLGISFMDCSSLVSYDSRVLSKLEVEKIRLLASSYMSVYMQQLEKRGTDFHEISARWTLLKFVGISVLVKIWLQDMQCTYIVTLMCVRATVVSVKKSKCYKFLCVFVVLGIQHAMRMRHIATCCLPSSTSFFHIVS
jgi:hypothetical protein